MRLFFLFSAALRGLLLASVLGFGLAHAQTEPTMEQIYATAQVGQLEQAQVMIQQVLVGHPNSAKAHFVQSQLFARQGNLPKAREAFATAQKLAPGLPFAKAEAVQALQAQLAGQAGKSGNGGNGLNGVNGGNGSNTKSQAAPTQEAGNASSGGWVLPTLLAGGVILLAWVIYRRKTRQRANNAPAAAAYNSGLHGPQNFGNAPMQPAYGQPGYPQPGYGQPGYGQPAYGQAPGSGLGGRIMGGVATGLAVGAGVVAAEAIGRSLMGKDDGAAHAQDTGNNFNQQSTANADMGGQDFGISDSSWDDGSASADAGGGSSDWDS